MQDDIYPKGRLCADPCCDTRLNQYNPGPYCHACKPNDREKALRLDLLGLARRDHERPEDNRGLRLAA